MGACYFLELTNVYKHNVEFVANFPPFGKGKNFVAYVEKEDFL